MYKNVRVFCNQCEVLSHRSSSCSVPNNSDLNHEVVGVIRGGGKMEPWEQVLPLLT